MGFIDSLRRVFAPTHVTYRISGAGGIAPVAGMDVEHLYRTQPNLRAVVTFLADNAAQVPWKVYERASECSTRQPRCS